MYALLLIVHLFICLGLIAVVLLQSGKGGGLAGGAFGGSAQTVFGGRGATDFMTRATMVLGAAFFVTSLALALMSGSQGRGGRSLIQENARRNASSSSTPVGTAPSGARPAAPAPAGTQAPAGGTQAPATPIAPTPPGGK
jgi:preprotein translocase subunit SecG